MGSSVRAEVVGSLLQPEELLDARKKLAAGEIDQAELRAAEDRAVDFCIAVQDEADLDVITDGEMRRGSWAAMTRLLDGIEMRDVIRSYPASVHQDDMNTPAPALTLVAPISLKEGASPTGDYGYLKARATGLTKFTVPAPSYYRRFWHDQLSTEAYPSCEAFLFAVRDWLKGVVTSLVDEGCPYIQLDAPNYGSLCDEENRAYHAAQGHDLNAELEFDGELDSSLLEGLNVIRAIHVCRGNWLGATWSSGGYDTIAPYLFPKLDVDAVLLEYDSERAGDFSPLQFIPEGTTTVLGMLTTKSNRVEHADALKGQIQAASGLKPISELALSTQCGFSSSGSNNPLTFEEQSQKLALISEVAHSLWPS